MLSCVQSSNHCKDYSIYSPPFLMLEQRCLLMMKGLQGQGHLEEVQVPPKAMLQALGGGCRQGWSGGADKVNGAKNGGTKVNET